MDKPNITIGQYVQNVTVHWSRPVSNPHLVMLLMNFWRRCTRSAGPTRVCIARSFITWKSVLTSSSRPSHINKHPNHSTATFTSCRSAQLWSCSNTARHSHVERKPTRAKFKHFKGISCKMNSFFLIDFLAFYFLQVQNRDVPNIRFVFASVPNSGPNSVRIRTNSFIRTNTNS